METLADLPKGPLDIYRKRASFNWKSLKVHLEGEDYVSLQVRKIRFNCVNKKKLVFKNRNYILGKNVGYDSFFT